VITKKKKPSKKKPKYRKDLKPPRNYVLGIYGRLIPLGYCNWYCDLHKCYLVTRDLKERNCTFKKCKHLKKLGKHKDIEK
jgi:hypothetical protein